MFSLLLPLLLATMAFEATASAEHLHPLKNFLLFCFSTIAEFSLVVVVPLALLLVELAVLVLVLVLSLKLLSPLLPPPPPLLLRLTGVVLHEFTPLPAARLLLRR